MQRQIIQINHALCDGCGACIPNCPEGALQVIDHKARLVSDLFCDGLGACVGKCPRGAMTVVTREAGEYDERRVMENIIPQGQATIRAHLRHLKDHGALEYYEQALAVLKAKGLDDPGEAASVEPAACACPGSLAKKLAMAASVPSETSGAPRTSRLANWPIQLKLVPVTAPYLKEAHLLVAADCAGFAHADLHRELMNGKVLLIACPKLDDTGFYVQKLAALFKQNAIRSITVLHMEVPCCFGLVALVEQAVRQAGLALPVRTLKLSVSGEVMEDEMGVFK